MFTITITDSDGNVAATHDSYSLGAALDWALENTPVGYYSSIVNDDGYEIDTRCGTVVMAQVDADNDENAAIEKFSDMRALVLAVWDIDASNWAQQRTDAAEKADITLFDNWAR